MSHMATRPSQAVIGLRERAVMMASICDAQCEIFYGNGTRDYCGLSHSRDCTTMDNCDKLHRAAFIARGAASGYFTSNG